MAQSVVTGKLWKLVRLGSFVCRYGLYAGTILTKENVSFEVNMQLTLGMPVWLPLAGKLTLVVPVMKFERPANNDSGRETKVCMMPAYVCASQLGKELWEVALKVTPKPVATTHS